MEGVGTFVRLNVAFPLFKMSSKSTAVAWIGIPRAPHIQDQRLWGVTFAMSVAGFGLYALYKQEYVHDFTSRLRSAVRAGCNAVDVMTKLTEITHTVLSDVHLFLQSDAEFIPQSLRQVTALLSTREFRNATRSLVMAFFEGLALSGGERVSLQNQPVFENLVERVIVQATRRPDLLSVAVRLATRHATDEIIQLLNVLKSPLHNGTHGNRGTTPLDFLLSRVSTDSGRRVMSSVVTAFTSTLVTVCIEKSRGIRTWDEIFQVISRPNNLRLIYHLAGLSSREFARSMIDGLATRNVPSPLCTEITAEVDYSVPVSSCQSSRIERSPTSEAVANLVDSFVTVTKDEQSRKFMYQFVGQAFAEVVKVLIKDFVNWFHKSVLSDVMDWSIDILYEFMIFCCIPLVHVFSTSLAIQTYPYEG